MKLSKESQELIKRGNEQMIRDMLALKSMLEEAEREKGFPLSEEEKDEIIDEWNYNWDEEV